MKLFSSNSNNLWKNILLLIIGFILVIGVFLYGFSNVSERNREENFTLMKQGIDRAIVNCYAIEGAYPPSFSYLEEHYGIKIDHEQYLVDYQIFGSNVKPAVQILSKGNGGTSSQ